MTNATQTQSRLKLRCNLVLRQAKLRQRGAVIITTMLTLLALLGFMGIATDFGHLFVVTPRLVKPLAHLPRLPTDNHVVPTRAEVYLHGSTENAKPAPAAPEAAGK